MSNEFFDIVHRISSAISQALSLEEVYDMILEEIMRVLKVERASIMRFDPKRESLKIVAAKGIEKDIWGNLEIKVGEGVSGRVWKEKKPVLIKRIQGNPRYKSHSYMIAPITCFPMKVRDIPIGLINVTDKKSGEPFTKSDLKLLMTISEQVASYMHLHHLMDRLKEAEKARQQLEVAREIQQRLLPKIPPKVPGLEMQGCLIPAARVGADYYDFLRGENQRLGICIADVSGHGVGGALLAFAIRSFLKAELETGKDSATIVAAANKLLFSDLFRSEQFISLFFAQYQPEERRLQFTNAGHNPPLLWRTSEKRGEWLTTQDSLIGIEQNLSFHSKNLNIQKGDCLVLYTDGLIEATNKEGERFGARRLEEEVAHCAVQNASDSLKYLLSRWKSFIASDTPQDDMTLVVLKAI